MVDPIALLSGWSMALGQEANIDIPPPQEDCTTAVDVAIDHIDHRQHALAAVRCFNFGRNSVNRLGGFRMTPGPLRSVA